MPQWHRFQDQLLATLEVAWATLVPAALPLKHPPQSHTSLLLFLMLRVAVPHHHQPDDASSLVLSDSRLL